MLIKGEAANAKTGYSPLLVRKCTDQDGNHNKWACVTNLLDFPVVPSFCFGGLAQSKLRSKRSGFYYLPPSSRKVSKKCKTCFSLPQLRDSRCTHWPSPSRGKMHPPPPPPRGFPFSQFPIPRAKAGHAYFNACACI